jgi:2-dehydropantoate 2-reductase
MFLEAVMEVSRVAEAHGARLPDDHRQRVFEYATKLPPATRSSLLIDLSQGKRIEVEALQGSVVRRGARVGVPTPIMAALYAVLRPHAGGAGVAG